VKRLHYLVIKSFLGPLVLTFFMVVFILLMQFLWKYIDDLVGKGLETSVLGEFLLYSSMSMVPMALPLAVLLSSLMTFGNLAENLELLALKSAGVSLFRIMFPLISVVTLITITAFLFANNIMPVSNLKLRALLYDIQRQRPELQIQPGIFDNTLEGYSIRIGEKDSRTNLLKDVWIYDHTDRAGNVSVTVADSGYMQMTADEKHLVLTLFSGRSYVEMEKTRKRRERKKTYPHRRDRFSKQEMIIEMTGFGLNRTDLDLFKNSFSMMNIGQLNHFEDSLTNDITILQGSIDETVRKNTVDKNKSRLLNRKAIDVNADTIVTESKYVSLHVDSAFSSLSNTEKRRAVSQAINQARSNKSYVSTNANTISFKTKRLRRYQIEKHRKFTLSFACMIFFFIGAPLGAIIRKGGLGMPVIVSVVFFLIYYMISITGEKFAREDMITPFAGMWLSTFILIPTSVFLTYKAANDSVIMNIDSYFVFLKKIQERFKKRMQQVK